MGAKPSSVRGRSHLGRCVDIAGATDQRALRDAADGLDVTTTFGRFCIVAAGRQIGHRMLLVHWRRGERRVVGRVGGRVAE